MPLGKLQYISYYIFFHNAVRVIYKHFLAQEKNYNEVKEYNDEQYYFILLLLSIYHNVSSAKIPSISPRV